MNLKNSLCRTCLSTIKEKEMFNIFDTEHLAEKITLCSALPVKATDEYPINVCLECYTEIAKFYKFRLMCSKSQETFCERLKAIEEKDNEDGDSLNNETEHKATGETGTNIDVPNAIETYVEKKKRGRPPKKKGKDYKTENNVPRDKLDQYDLVAKEDGGTKILQSSLLYENSSDSQLYDTSPSLNKLPIQTGLDANECDLNRHCDLGKKTLSPKGFRNPSEEPKSVKQYDRRDQNVDTTECLEAHKKRDDCSPPYTCSYTGCSKSFIRWSFFNKHQKDHKAKQDLLHKCDVDNCERVYKNKCALNIHKRKCHNYGPELKRHMCEICGKLFKSATVLSDHRYTHIDRNQLPFACAEKGCSKRFSTKEKLRVHKMRHDGIKNFVCPYCGMRKTTRNELKIHINYHTLERTWPCRFCPKVCNSAGNLKMHVKNIHEKAKDFACRFCESTFAKADTRKYHEMIHTGEKPHKCEQCGRRFVQPAALRTHRKIHLKQKKNCRKEENAGETKIKDRAQNKIEVIETTIITEAMVAAILNDDNASLE